MGRFVKPQVVRLPISRGDYIDVKGQLNTGESQDLWARMSPYQVLGEPSRLDSREVMIARVLAYLLGWSLTDEGVPVPMSPEITDAARLSTIRSLDTDTFREIFTAVDEHEARVEKAISDLKNGTGTPSESAAT